eukprot:105697-Prymnesium_polylepis.1
MSEHDTESMRLQAAIDALPPGRAGDASRAGLKKKLAAHKAVGLREVRKREMAERETARRAQEAAAQAQRDLAAAQVEPQIASAHP